MTNSSIDGIGTAVPQYRMNQQDVAEIAKTFSCQSPDQQRLLPVLYRRTAVTTRHSVLIESNEGPVTDRQSFYAPALDAHDRGPTTSQRMQRYEIESACLALEASIAALNDANTNPDQITHLVTVSCSGFHAPGFDIDLINKLELPADIARTHIGFMGCHGLLNGMRVAGAFTAADPNARVLLCAVELCSLHQQYGWDPEQIVANALFADGAAATVLSSCQSSDDRWQLKANGSAVIADSADAMQWRIGDHGFEMTLSAHVPELIANCARPWLEQWLGAHNLAVNDVQSWAVHPGGPRILGAFSEAVELPQAAFRDSYDVLAEFGNMSSPTVLFILDRLRRAHAPRPCVALGFGPGLAIEAALFV